MSISFKKKREPLIINHFPPDFFDGVIVKKKLTRPASHTRDNSLVEGDKTPEWPNHQRNFTALKPKLLFTNLVIDESNKENMQRPVRFNNSYRVIAGKSSSQMNIRNNFSNNAKQNVNIFKL